MHHHTENDFSTYVQTQTDSLFVIINGNQCTTQDDLYDTLVEALNLPLDFGRNLDALEEVLYDLDFLENQNLQLIFYNYKQLLQDDLDYKKEFQLLLEELLNDFVDIVLID